MKILIDYFKIEGISSYPDNAKLFAEMETLTIDGNMYYYVEYSGNKDIRTTVVSASQFSKYLATEAKAAEERLWRDKELVRTDSLVILPDYPRDNTDLIAYRTALADYPITLSFPYGERPNPKNFIK